MALPSDSSISCLVSTSKQLPAAPPHSASLGQDCWAGQGDSCLAPGPQLRVAANFTHQESEDNPRSHPHWLRSHCGSSPQGWGIGDAGRRGLWAGVDRRNHGTTVTPGRGSEEEAAQEAGPRGAAQAAPSIVLPDPAEPTAEGLYQRRGMEVSLGPWPILGQGGQKLVWVCCPKTG